MSGRPAIRFPSRFCGEIAPAGGRGSLGRTEKMAYLTLTLWPYVLGAFMLGLAVGYALPPATRRPQP